MEPKSFLVKQIESFVDSSASSSQQAANVSSIASLLKNGAITMEFLVREMEMYLTTTDHILRARGILLLAEVLEHLRSKPLDNASIHTLVGFFTERLADWRALRGALVGCLALVRRKFDAGVVTEADAKLLAKSFLENLQVQSLGQLDRKMCFELLECLIERYPKSISLQGDHVVYGVCEAIEGEKDPQCLMHVFCIVEGLAKIFPEPSGPLATFAEDLFDIIGCYFPIHYTHTKGEDVDVNRDELSKALMLAFSASPFFEPFAIPLLLEKLSSNLPIAKIDSLRYLSYCIVKYGPERLAKHAGAIWSSLKAALCDFQTDVSTLASDLSNSMGFQESEITKEALVLLQQVASQQSNSFVNLVLEDKDINGLLNYISVSGSYKSVPPLNEQNLRSVGRVFSVLAKASTTSCNSVFDTLFLRLLDNLGASVSTSKDMLAVDSNLSYQGLNFCAGYICVEILGACRELAVTSVRETANYNFVEDAWCQTLARYSYSLMKAFISNLESSTAKMYHDEDVSLRVKGLQILATFPGHSVPVSTTTFDTIMGIFVSIVNNNFNMPTLWNVSLNALAETGTFLYEYPYSEKLLSYTSTVVERLISLISSDDSAIPFSLLLEALSKIGATGHTVLLKIVQGMQDTISVKFAKFYLDGDVKVCADLVQLLDCYSIKLLPWFHTVEGSESLLLRFAIDIWDQIEAATASSFIVEGKPLLDATRLALKLAVAMLLEEGQLQITEKAFDVISSNLSFVPNSKLGELKISGDPDGFLCRDEWLTSLFASVVIALRPKTLIGNFRAVIELLLTSFIKGQVASAQALGSIINKMPLKNDDMHDFSYLDLDAALSLILESILGRYSKRILSSSSEIDSGELCPNVSIGLPLQGKSISGLAWIGKGLLMRGHEKLKDITMIFFSFLVSNTESEALTGDKSLSAEGEIPPLMANYAADAFNILMSDSEDCLNKTFHAIIRPLYKQRFFSTVMPILLSAVKKTQSHSMRSMLYRAIGHVISNTPVAAILIETKKVLPVLLDAISALSEDSLDKDMIYNLLLVISGLLMDKNVINIMLTFLW
ncbi:MMS19 nucleotide excision repair protein homolog isoform X2 [Amaranthus tricolor]|uniref:MMS19 nucleotide excision repair protein homolog isoform X2 n=1 Tax=Amaranthus tricolor TaxID=29722 RepID=UPI0025881BE7|nr:MMS19 nucleotide excision repair protein homolog isoform X2 [Amaranthus tricolor]